MIVARGRGITHDYADAGTPVRALSDVSLALGTGELVLVVGPSGSGKSTLLAILAGLTAPTTGDVWLADEELTRLDAAGRARVRREQVGFVFQSFHLFGALTARGNVECVLELRGLSRREQIARAEAALEEVGLSARAHHLPERLSGGERQRVALARALAVTPRIVFGDEPTSALDSRSAALVIERIRAFVRAGNCAVLSTHDPRMFEIATRIVTLEDGRLVRDTGPTTALEGSPG